MTSVIINDILPLTQAIAVGSQTVYSTDWTANYPSDVVVYSRPINTAADDATQILDPSLYTVAFIGSGNIVQVTLVTPSTAGDIVTITRMTPADRENLYTNTNFTPSMLNNDFGILTLVDQQAQLVNQQIGPRYNYSAIIQPIVDTILPILLPNQTWIKNANNTAIIGLNVPSGGVAPADATFLTATDQTSVLPNSSRLLAGANVTLTQGANTLTVSVTGQAINPGTANNLGYYASSGSVISPLSTSANGVLVTNVSGVPSISTTLPAGLTIPTPMINEILDSNGNPLLSMTTIPNAVNYFLMENNATGVSPVFGVAGTDTNISLSLVTKGTGLLSIVTGALTQPLLIYSGTANQHLTRFNMANTAADRSVTFQDSSGTLAYLSNLTGFVTSVGGTTNRITSTGGTTPAIDIAANYVGQSSITTLGTITTGTWDGTVVAGQYGGTGVANTGLTINLGSPTAGYLLTSDSSGNATWQAPGYLTGAVLLNPSADQSILAHNLTLAAGTLTIGSSSGGVNGSLTLFPTTASAGGFRILNNTASSFTSTVSNSSLGQATTFTIPDPGASTANFLLNTSAAGKTINYQLTMPSIAFSSTSGVIGTTTNNNAATGSVGEFLSASLGFGTPVSLVDDTATDVVTLSLTAGDWDVWGFVGFGGGSTTLVTTLQGWISQSSATHATADVYTNMVFASAGVAIFASDKANFNVQRQRISLSTTTTIYLSVFADFTISTCNAYGNIRARRVR